MKCYKLPRRKKKKYFPRETEYKSSSIFNLVVQTDHGFKLSHIMFIALVCLQDPSPLNPFPFSQKSLTLFLEVHTGLQLLERRLLIIFLLVITLLLTHKSHHKKVADSHVEIKREEYERKPKTS